MTHYKAKRFLLLSIVFSLIIVSFNAAQGKAQAAVPKLDNIRVALFIDTSRYHLNSPTVTLSSESGLNIGLRTSAGVHNWIGGSTLKTIRGTVDQFMVQLLETSDAAQAASLKQRLSEANYTPYVFQLTKKGMLFTQVWTGPYPTKETAAAAKDAITKNTTLMAMINVPNNTPKLTGPLHWNAGSYATVAEAVYMQSSLSQAGIAVDLTYQANPSGSVQYSVWLGHETDQAALDLLKQQTLAVVPTLALTPVDPNAAYLLKRDDLTSVTSGQPPIPNFFFNAKDQRVWINAVNETRITVKEKGSRTYRGSMELTQNNGKMALINELPFEQYLYGVVGSEMATGWPQEALKAQAVAARTYALIGGNAYNIANISDSTTDQVYTGVEYNDVIKAVDATKGEVLTDQNGLITPFYSANAGGVTSDPGEIWGGNAAYLKSAPSPGDNVNQSKAIWHHVALADGTTGYVHSDYLKDTGLRNNIGLSIYEATELVNIRLIASSRDNISPTIGKLNKGDRVTSFGQTVQSGSYTWQRGPVDANGLADTINHVLGPTITGPLLSLQVASRGPSGRVTGLQANGQAVKAAHPDSYRTVLGGLPSTLFDIEQTGSYTVLGANGSVSTYPQTASGSLYVLHGQDKAPVTQKQWFVMNSDKQVRLVTSQQEFMFTGKGYGHGLGMSQDGAYGLAQQGYDYVKILKSFYTGVNIVKE
jgi:stage II sporulation protein D